MSTTFPTNLDTFVDPVGNNLVTAPDHAGQHTNINDSMVSVQAKVGINGSTVATSMDYKLSTIPSSDKAVSFTGTETLLNKTLTSPVINNPLINNPLIGSGLKDLNGNAVLDVVGTASAVNEARVTNSATGTAPLFDVAGTDTNIDIAIKGKGTGSVRLGLAGLRFPNADASSGQVLKTDGSGNLSFSSIASNPPAWIDLAHIQGGSIPASAYTDQEAYFAIGTASFFIDTVGNPMQTRNVVTDWASANAIRSIVVLSGFVYIWVRDTSNNYRVYRFDKTNLASGGTLMTISGQAFSTTGGGNTSMVCDGTNFWFNYKGGNSANDYVVSKYTISGTTLTYSLDVTCGASSNACIGIMVDALGNIYGLNTSDAKFRKFNSSGTLQYTTAGFTSVAGPLNYSGTFYIGVSTSPIVGYAKVNL
jgi:hypothetical protein